MKEMPTAILPADSEYVYVPDQDDWVVKKKSGNKILSKKDIKSDILDDPITPYEEVEQRGSREISTSDPEYEFLMRLINVVIKAGVPAQEIKTLSEAYPFVTIDDAGDLAAKIWTLATETYNIPKSLLYKKLPEKKSNLKQAYEGGYPTEEDSVQWGMAPSGTYAYEPYKRDSKTGEREGDSEPKNISDVVKYYIEHPHEEHGVVVDISTKDRTLKFEDGFVVSFDDVTNIAPKPDRGSDDLAVNDYSQNYFWGPNDLGRSHQNQPGANGWLPAGTEDMDGPSSNVRMSSLEKRAYVEEVWIAPDGEVFDIEGYHHDSWIVLNTDILIAKGYSPKEVKPLERLNLEDLTTEQEGYLDSWFNRLLKDGWVRISSGSLSGKYQFIVNAVKLDKIPSIVDTFVAENFDSTSGLPIGVGTDKQHVEISDPFPSLQKAVNKALRQPAMSSFKSFMRKQSVLNRIAYFGEGYWVSPDNKLFPVRSNYKSQATHEGWLKRNRKMLMEKYNISPENNEELIDNGWIRIGDYGGDNVFLIELPTIKNIPSSVDVAISKLFKPGSIINVEDSEGNYVELDDPFPSLQKAISKELQQKRIGKKAHCGPCSVIKAEVIKMLADMKYKDESVKSEDLEALADFSADPSNDSFIQYLGEVIEALPEEHEKEVQKLKNHKLALEDIQKRLDEGDMVTDKQEHVEKEADLKEYSNRITKDINDRIIRDRDLMSLIILKAQIANSPEELEKDFITVFSKDPITEALQKQYNEYIFWDELAYAWYSSVKGGEDEQRRFNKQEPLVDFNIENLPTLDKSKKLDELLEQLSVETNPQKKEQIKQHIERIKNASLNKQARMDSPSWIDPNGKIYTFSDQTHETWIEHNVKMLGQMYSIDFSNMGPRDSYVSYLLDEGWARASVADSVIVFQTSDLNNLSKLDDYVAQNWKESFDYVLIETYGGTWKIANPFPSLEKAMQRREKVSAKQASLLDEVLDQTTQDAIASEYGPSMLIAMRFYNDAVRYGQNPQRAMEYALEEVKRMRRPIEQRNFLEVLDTYF